MRKAIAPTLLVLLLGAGCSSGDDTSSDSPDTSVPAAEETDDTTSAAGDDTGGGAATEYTAEVWADNWFALYVDGEQVGEDSVPITTERSFNAETITFTAGPSFTIGVVARDYIEDDSGLEYIGTDRQQMGDGGLIVQVTNTETGEVVAGSGDTWRGLVIHTAPTNPECEQSSDPAAECESDITDEPAGWADPDFDDSSWAVATTYTAEEVGAKEGYDEIRWDPTAALIWSGDLETDNTILWRATVG